MPMLKTKTDLASSVEQVKNEIQALRQRAAELRAEIKDLRRIPLARAEIIIAARADADRRKTEALESLSFRFKRGNIDDAKFFRGLGDVQSLLPVFIAGGGLDRLLDEMEKVPELKGSMTSEAKAARGVELQRELGDVERSAESARVALETDLGLVYPPDPDISPAVFLEFSGGKFNAAKIRRLQYQQTAANSAGSQMIQYGVDLRRDIQSAKDSLERYRHQENAPADCRKKEEAIAALEREAAEQNRKIAEHHAKSKMMDRVLSRGVQFLADNGIKFAD